MQDFPPEGGLRKEGDMSGIGGYLRKHTEALVKDVGIEAA